MTIYSQFALCLTGLSQYRESKHTQEVCNKLAKWSLDQDTNPVIRKLARENLIKVGKEFAIKAVVPYLNSSLCEYLQDFRASLVRCFAAQLLGEIGGSLAIKHLVMALEDKDLLVRENVVRSLGVIGNSDTIQTLINAYWKTNENSLKEEIATALSGMNVHATFEAMNNFRKDKNNNHQEEWNDYQWQSIFFGKVFSKIENQESILFLINTIEDKRVIEYYSGYTGGILRNTPTTHHYLIEALEDNNNSSSIRLSAARTLDKMKALDKINDSSIKSLINAFSNKDNSERREIAKLLGIIQNSIATSTLVDAINDKDSKLRLIAAVSLGQIGDPAASQSLINIIEDDGDSSNDERKKVFESEKIAFKDWLYKPSQVAIDKIDEINRLRNKIIGETDIVQSLTNVLKDEENSIDNERNKRLSDSIYLREAAAVSLGFIGNPATTIPLINILNDASIVSEGASFALNRLIEKHKAPIALIIFTSLKEDFVNKTVNKKALAVFSHSLLYIPYPKYWEICNRQLANIIKERLQPNYFEEQFFPTLKLSIQRYLFPIDMSNLEEAEISQHFCTQIFEELRTVIPKVDIPKALNPNELQRELLNVLNSLQKKAIIVIYGRNPSQITLKFCQQLIDKKYKIRITWLTQDILELPKSISEKSLKAFSPYRPDLKEAMEEWIKQ